MGGTRRHLTLALAAVAVALAGTGCGAINKGQAFASEFEPLLQDREHLAFARVVGTSSLPWTGQATVYVELVPDLDDAEMAEEIWEITALEVDNQIRYDLRVLFPAETASGGPATAGLYVGVDGPAPDEERLRDDLEERIGLARDLAALGEGETVASPGRWSARFDTEADAVAVALGICADDDLADSVSSLTISGRAADGAVNRVTLRDASDCDWVADVNDVIEVADSLGLLEEAVAQQGPGADQPELRLTFVPPAPVDLTELQRLATEAGIALTVL